jgi:hypothetical protein
MLLLRPPENIAVALAHFNFKKWNQQKDGMEFLVLGKAVAAAKPRTTAISISGLSSEN